MDRVESRGICCSSGLTESNASATQAQIDRCKWLRSKFVCSVPRHRYDQGNDRIALFKGTCVRGIYDNMKTAVETIFVGKGRLYNRRFMQMCSQSSQRARG